MNCSFTACEALEVADALSRVPGQLSRKAQLAWLIAELYPAYLDDPEVASWQIGQIPSVITLWGQALPVTGGDSNA